MLPRIKRVLADWLASGARGIGQIEIQAQGSGFNLCHVDGTLVMGDHYRSEVTIRITAWDNAHVPVHAFHRLRHQ